MKKTGSEIAKILTNRFVRSLRVNIIPSDCTELYENLTRKHNVIFIITDKDKNKTDEEVDDDFPRIEVEYNKGYVRWGINKGYDENGDEIIDLDCNGEDSENIDYKLLSFGKELYKNLEKI